MPKKKIDEWRNIQLDINRQIDTDRKLERQYALLHYNNSSILVDDIKGNNNIFYIKKIYVKSFIVE